MKLSKRAEKLRDEMCEKIATMECLASDFKELDSTGFACAQAGFDQGYSAARLEAKVLEEALKNAMPIGHSEECNNLPIEAGPAYCLHCEIEDALKKYREGQE